MQCRCSAHRAALAAVWAAERHRRRPHPDTARAGLVCGRNNKAVGPVDSRKGAKQLIEQKAFALSSTAADRDGCERRTQAAQHIERLLADLPAPSRRVKADQQQRPALSSCRVAGITGSAGTAAKPRRHAWRCGDLWTDRCCCCSAAAPLECPDTGVPAADQGGSKK